MAKIKKKNAATQFNYNITKIIEKYPKVFNNKPVVYEPGLHLTLMNNINKHCKPNNFLFEISTVLIYPIKKLYVRSEKESIFFCRRMDFASLLSKFQQKSSEQKPNTDSKDSPSSNRPIKRDELLEKYIEIK